MRVFFSNHSTAPVNLGGAERSLLKLVEDWQRINPDFEPFFLTKAPEGQFIRALKERGFSYRAFRFRGWALPSAQPAPFAERAAFAAPDYAAVRAMISEMEKQKPDLVVTNTLVAPWAAFAAKTLGIPHAWFVREYGDLDHGLQFQIGIDATLDDIGLLSEGVFTNSHALEKRLIAHMSPEKVSVVYPSVDGEDARIRATEKPALAPFPSVDPGLKITVVGRVEPGKGQYRVVDAIGALAAREIPASACFVGSWKEPGYDVALRDRARALRIVDRITFVGEQENPYPYITAADVCVTPSTLEAFGRTTLEYMLLGKAVVASRAGGSAELVDPGVTGRLFDLNRPDELVDALAAYASNPSAAAQHGAAAAARLDVLLEGHGNDRAIQRLESLTTGEVYRLPQMARYWFELPEAFSALGATSARAALGLVVSRVRSRTGFVGRLLSRPRSSVRRLLGR